MSSSYFAMVPAQRLISNRYDQIYQVLVNFTTTIWGLGRENLKAHQEKFQDQMKDLKSLKRK